MEPVLSNNDLVRKLLSYGSDTVGLLRVNRSTRQAEECASTYETWAATDCPAQATGADERCLHALGGLESEFCVGRFEVQTNDTKYIASTRRFAEQVRQILQENEGTRVKLKFTWRGIEVFVYAQPTRKNMILTIHNGWGKKGNNCTPTTFETQTFIHGILTRVGTVALPCPPKTKAIGPIVVPRKLSVTISRYDETEGKEETEEVLLNASRA